MRHMLLVLTNVSHDCQQKHISILCYFLDICESWRTPQSHQLFMDYICSKRHLWHNASNITHHHILHTSVKFQPGQTSPNPKLWYKYRYVYYHKYYCLNIWNEDVCQAYLGFAVHGCSWCSKGKISKASFPIQQPPVSNLIIINIRIITRVLWFPLTVSIFCELEDIAERSEES